MAEANKIPELLQAAMRASQLKSRVTANNIANLDTPGYRRKDVRFDELLARVLKSPGGLDPKSIHKALFAPMTTEVNGEGNDVSLDLEVGEMIKNGARYKMYVRLLRKMYSQMTMAITGRL